MSIAAIASRSQTPPETVRRHLDHMVTAGLCEVAPEGIRLAAGVLDRDEWRNVLRENAIALQRMFAGLSERGVVAFWDDELGTRRARG